MKMMAAMAMEMPTMMLVVMGSLKAIVPTMMAVIGSKTPSTDAFVAPILRVDSASVAVEMMVGKMARPTKQNHADEPLMPVVKSLGDRSVLI